MPETTTAKNACDIKLLVDNSSGILVDISGSANRVEAAFTQQMGEYPVFGGAWVKRLICKKDATVTVQIVYTTAANEGWKLLKDWWNNYNDQPRTIRWMAPTDEVGADDFHGEVLIDSMTVPFDGGQAGPVMVALTLRQTDGLFIDTIAT